jgi:hypothetical protein
MALDARWAIGLILCAVFGAAMLWNISSGPEMVSFDGSTPTFEGSASSFSSSIVGTTGKMFSGRQVHTFPAEDFRFQAHVQEGPLQKEEEGPEATIDCANWAVVTTIFLPSKAIELITKYADFCVVIVADKKTPNPYNLSGDNVVVLDVAYQESLKDPFSSAIPWNHFGRKNLGFMYAIAHGAEMIFDFDDDNEPVERGDKANPTYAFEVPATVILFQPAKDGDAAAAQERIKTAAHSANTATGLAKDKTAGGCTSVNLYPGMSLTPTFAWPRGFPLTQIRNPACTPTTEALAAMPKAPGATVAVFQSLADHDPDVDALYRLTQPLPIVFKPDHPTVAIPPGLFLSYNAQASLHRHEALWGLYLPITVHGRVSDIWRAYITQRLLWDVGRTVSLTPPQVVQIRNPHNYLADFAAEQDLYSKTEQLLLFLRDWQAPEDTSLPARIELLWAALYERTYVGLGDVYGVQRWIQRLVDVDYEFPKPVKTEAVDS